MHPTLCATGNRLDRVAVPVRSWIVGWHYFCLKRRPMEKNINELQLDILTEICRIVEQALNLDQALEALLGILSDFLPMQTAIVTLKDDETGRFLIRASHGLTWPRGRGVSIPRARGWPDSFFARDSRSWSTMKERSPFFLKKTMPQPMDKRRIALLGVPIAFHGSSIGVISVNRLFDDAVPLRRIFAFWAFLPSS